MGRPRGRLALTFVENKQARKTTYLKRKGCIMKKANELSVLCGVDTCAIVYDGSESNCPQTWPPNRSEVEGIINRYRLESKKDTVRAKKTYGLLDFLENQKNKIDNQAAKVRLESLKAKFQVDDLTKEELQSLALNLDQKIEMAKKRLELLKTSSSSGPAPMSVWRSDLPSLQDYGEHFCLKQDDVMDLSTLQTYRDNAEASNFNNVSYGLELVSTGPMPLSNWQFDMPPLQEYGEDICLKQDDVVDLSTMHSYRDNAKASNYGLELVIMNDDTPSQTSTWCNYEHEPNDCYYQHDHGMDFSKQAFNAIQDHQHVNDRDNAEASNFNNVSYGLELVRMGPMPLSNWQSDLPPLQEYGEDICLKQDDVIDLSTMHTYRDNAKASNYGLELVIMNDDTPSQTSTWCNYEHKPNDCYYQHDHGMDFSKQAFNAIHVHQHVSDRYEMQPAEQFLALLHCGDQSAVHPLGVSLFQLPI